MAKPDILILRPVMQTVTDQLARRFPLSRLWEESDRDAFLDRIGPRIRGVVAGGPVDAALIARLPALEIVSNFGVGYDGVDTAACAAAGVVVTNTPDVLTDEVADLALGLLLATVRELPQADRYVRAGRWLERPYPLTATLRGRRLGILGLGRIGRAIAGRAAAFGLAIAYHGRSRQPDVPYDYHETPADLARAVDILMVVAPGGAGTRHIVNAEVLEALGPDGVLINVARGSLVDETALITALEAGTIRAAGLDVFADEPRVPERLIARDNVVLLPHVGSASVHTRNAMAQLVVDNLMSWFDGRGPLTPVPETPVPRR
ncbi:MAG: 2-hydroxyacid dehydrogenase [Ferrovibrionaceae bacterium]